MSSVKGEKTFVEMNWVEVTDADVDKVVGRSGLSVARIREYLSSEEQDNNILRHFAFIRVYPKGKLFK